MSDFGGIISVIPKLYVTASHGLRYTAKAFRIVPKLQGRSDIINLVEAVMNSNT
jgi:hypothetical protein